MGTTSTKKEDILPAPENLLVILPCGDCSRHHKFMMVKHMMAILGTAIIIYQGEHWYDIECANSICQG